MKCLLTWEDTQGQGWFYPPDFFKDGKDGCERMLCGFTTCQNYGKPFDEPRRLLGIKDGGIE